MCFTICHIDGPFENLIKEDLLSEVNATYLYSTSRRSKDLAMQRGLAKRKNKQAGNNIAGKDGKDLHSSGISEMHLAQKVSGARQQSARREHCFSVTRDLQRHAAAISCLKTMCEMCRH